MAVEMGKRSKKREKEGERQELFIILSNTFPGYIYR
jgi:hypothetical protein